MSNFSQLIEDFMKWKETKNLSKTTEKNYIWALRFLDKAYKESVDKPIDDVNIEDVRILLAWIYDKKVDKTSPKEGYPRGYLSYNYLKGIVKQLFRFKIREDIVRDIGSTSIEEPDIRPLSLEEVRNITSGLLRIHSLENQRVMERNAQIAKGRRCYLETDPERDRLLILTLFSTGLRASELCSLKMSDLVLEKNMGFVSGKGRKRRKDRFYFVFNSGELLKDYIEKNRILINDLGGCIFIRNIGKPFDYHPLYRLIKMYSSYFYYRFTPHTFRHSIAVYLLNNGWNPAEVQKFLRHRNVKTTSRYLQDTEELLQRKIFEIKDEI